MLRPGAAGPHSALSMPSVAIVFEAPPDAQTGVQAPTSDGGEAALAVLTSDVRHSWRHMLAQGATATMEAWDAHDKWDTTWSHVWSASPGFVIPWLLFGLRCVAPGCAQLQVRLQSSGFPTSQRRSDFH